MKFTLLLWWVFSPLSLVGERRSSDNTTQQVDVYLVDQVGDGLHRGKLYTCTHVQVRVTGTCPTHCVASWHSEALGMPTRPPHRCWHQLHLNTQPPTAHTLLYATSDVSAWQRPTHTRLTVTGGFSCQMLPHITSQTSAHWYHAAFSKNNLSDIGYAKKLQATQACTQAFPDVAGGAHLAQGDCHSKS